MVQSPKREKEQFEQLFHQALQEYTQKEDIHFASLLDAQIDDTHIDLEECDLEIEMLLKQNSPHTNRFTHQIFRHLKKWGIPVAAVFILICTVALTSNASIIDIFHWLFSSTDTYISMEEAGQMEEQCVVEIIGNGGWDAFYLPQNLPNGFIIQDIQIDKRSCTIRFYRDSDKAVIRFSQYPLTKPSIFSAQYDNEDLEVLKEIEVDGNVGLLIQKKGQVLVAFDNNDFYFQVFCTNLDTDIIVDFCQNLKKVSK